MWKEHLPQSGRQLDQVGCSASHSLSPKCQSWVELGVGTKVLKVHPTLTLGVGCPCRYFPALPVDRFSPFCVTSTPCVRLRTLRFFQDGTLVFLIAREEAKLVSLLSFGFFRKLTVKLC